MRILFVLTVFSFAVCFAQSPKPSLERKFAEQVSQERLLQNVRDLVRFGNRLGGTASGDKATDYVLKKLKSFGYRPVSVEESERLTYKNDRWILEVEEPKSMKKFFKNEWLAGFSPTVSLRSARLTYVDPEADFEPARVESSAALVPFPVAHDVYEKFVGAGALCILSYTPNDAGSYEGWSLITDLPRSSSNAIPVFALSIHNGDSLKRELNRGRNVVIKYSTKTSIAMGQPKTVIATLQGSSEKYFLVCAHGDSDSGGPGADDNASGVSGVLELARVLKKLVSSKTIPQPRYSIKFVIWGSEYSSAEEFVVRQSEGLDKILAVLNYDEIGTGKTRNCLYFEGNDIPQNERILRVIQKVAEDYVGKKGFWKEATTNPSQGGTDSYVFLQDYLEKLSMPNVEIPSITVYTAAWGTPKTLLQTEGWTSKSWRGPRDSVHIDFSPYYHSSLDIPATTTEREPFNMPWAVKAVGISLLRLAWQ